MFARSLTLIFVLLFGSPELHQHVDFKVAAPVDERRMDKLWVVTFLDEAGVETIAQARLTSGETVPLMAVDQDRLSSIIEASKSIASARKIKLRLVEFGSRSDVGEFSP